MTELGYRPDQQMPLDAPQERFMFVPAEDRRGREFDVTPELPVTDISAETQAVNDAYAQQVLDRQRRVAEEREAAATEAQLRYSIECDTIAMAGIQDYTERYGFDPVHEELPSRDGLELAA